VQLTNNVSPFYFCVHSHGLIVARNKGSAQLTRGNNLSKLRDLENYASYLEGSISFGLVYIPIAVYPATREEKLSFRQLRATDLSPSDTKKWLRPI